MRTSTIGIALLALVLGTACSPKLPTKGTITVKDLGVIEIEFLPDKAPKTVENFAKLAGDGLYDGTTFHRVIPGFMIQGGDPRSKNDNPNDDGTGGPGYRIKDEFSDVAHERGVISMANMGYPDSGGSQFFIVVKDSPFLDGKYTAFARVVSGMEVADAVAAVEKDARDRPLENVVVESVRVE
jgi:peptidyl-prolyl cis-trans isomerase B (cyclophilin B)